MTDHELLELAAKAAGFYGSRVDERGWFQVYTYPGHNGDGSDSEWELWSPLDNDGDALRLAVKLQLRVIPPEDEFGLDRASVRIAGVRDLVDAFDPDPYAATRRAIVRAAAKIKQINEL